MLNYSLAEAVFQSTVLGGRSMNATLFTMVNGYWPPDVDLLSELEAMRGLSADEMYFITAWLPSQMFFVVAHKFVHHLIWCSQQDSSQVHNVRLLSGKEIEVYSTSQKDEIRADEIVFDIWDQLDATLSYDFQAFTAGGLGALFGYFRILEKYAQSLPTRSASHSPAADRYERVKARLFNTGRLRSLWAMEETWAVTQIMAETCVEARKKQEVENTISVTTKSEDPHSESI
jgi:hypothetical protein